MAGSVPNPPTPFRNVPFLSARKVVQEADNVRSWIICDGDIDPVWIEALNSVLDDNHLLTMPNGERIKFGPNVNFIFETDSLELRDCRNNFLSLLLGLSPTFVVFIFFALFFIECWWSPDSHLRPRSAAWA